MTAVAIYSAGPVLRCSLEHLLREDPAMTVVGVADNPSAILRLIEQNHVDAVLANSRRTISWPIGEPGTAKQPSWFLLTGTTMRTASRRSMQGPEVSYRVWWSAAKSSSRSRRSPAAWLFCRVNCCRRYST